MVLLTVITIGWFVLAAVNLARANLVVALAYGVCGVVVGFLTVRMSRGRRSR